MAKPLSTTWGPRLPLRADPPFDIDKDVSTRFAFRAFLLLSAVIFFGPQFYLPWLIPFQIGKIFSGLAIVTYVLAVKSQGRPLTRWGREEKLLVALVGLEFASIPFSRWPGGSLAFMFDMPLKSAVVFFLAANLLNSAARIRMVCWWLLACSIWNAAIGVQDYLSGNFFAYNRIIGGAAPLIANPNDLALVLNMMLPVIWYLYSTSHRRVVRMICLGAMALSVAAIIATFSRAGFVTLCIVGGVFIWRKARKYGPAVLVAAALVGILIIALAPGGYGTRILSSVDSSLDETGSAEVRSEVMKTAVATMISHPLGIGVGMNVLSAVDAGLVWILVHNSYLEIGVELGVLGLVVYVLLIRETLKGLGVLITAHPNRNLAALAEAVQLSLIAFAAAVMFYPVAHHFYFYFMGGIAVAVKCLAKAHASPSSQETQPDLQPAWLRGEVPRPVARG
jgi:O-antigen ligase